MKSTVKKSRKIKSSLKNPQILSNLKSIGFFAAGFILCLSNSFGNICPFAVSLICVSKKNEFIYTALGSALGYLLFCPENFARYGITVVIALLGTLAMILAKSKNSPVMPMVISFLSLGATGIVVNLKNSAPAAEYALTAGEAILGAGGAFFFFKALNAGFKRFHLKALPTADVTCIVISLSIIFMSLARLNINGIVPVRIIAVAATLIILRFSDSKSGIMLALALGFVLGITANNAVFITGAYGFSALLASLFCPFGSLAAAVSFLLSTALFCVASGSEVALPVFIETLIGCALFSVIPPVLAEKAERFFHDGADITPDGSLRQSLVMRLRFAAGAVNYISESVNEVREKINAVNERNFAENKGNLTETEYITNQIINEKTNEIRMVASDQFFQ